MMETKPDVAPAMHALLEARGEMVVGLLDFSKRRAACSKCELRNADESNNGLYGCGDLPPERILLADTTCPLSRWTF